MQIDKNCWRKDSELPVGRAIAEIHKQDDLPLYTARVEVIFDAHYLPQNMIKTTSGIGSLAEVQGVCNALLAECVAAEVLSQAPYHETGHAAWPPS
jgi:hypothetical protein